MADSDLVAKRGDTWKGVAVTITVDGTPLNLTGAEIRCQFRKTRITHPILDLSVGNGITITDAINGKLSIDPVVIDVAPDVFKYDLQVKQGVEITTYLSGTLTVIEDVTHD